MSRRSHRGPLKKPQSAINDAPKNKNIEPSKQSKPASHDPYDVKTSIDALTNTVKAKWDEEKSKTDWSAVGAKAAIVYTVFTAVIIFVTVYQANLARQSFIGTQRAYVVPEGIELSFTPETIAVQKPWALRPRFQNSGATPTRELVIKSNLCFRNEKLPDTFTYPALQPENFLFPMRQTIGPKDTIAGNDFRLKQSDIAAIGAGKLLIYLYGEATYKDIVDSSVTHTTRFCYIFDSVGIRDGVVSPTYISCLKHNCADDECIPEIPNQSESGMCNAGYVMRGPPNN